MKKARNSFKVDLQAMAVDAPAEGDAAQDELDLDLGDLDAQLDELEEGDDNNNSEPDAPEVHPDSTDNGVAAERKADEAAGEPEAPRGAGQPADGLVEVDNSNPNEQAEADKVVEQDAEPATHQGTEAAADQDTGQAVDAAQEPEGKEQPAPAAKPLSKPAVLKRKGLAVAKVAPKAAVAAAAKAALSTSKPADATPPDIASVAAKAKEDGQITAAEPAKAKAPASKALAVAKPKADAAASKPAAKPKAEAGNSKPAAKPKKEHGAEKGEKEGKGEKRPRAQSAYNFFTAEKRVDLKKAEPGLSMGDMSKKLGELWKAMTDEEKAPYEAKATADKEGVRVQQEQWDASHPKEGPAAKKQKVACKKPSSAPAPAAAAKPTGGQPPAGKPKSAFASFAAARRTELRAEVADATLAEISEMIEQEWRNMNDEEKAAFEPGGWALQQLVTAAAQASQEAESEDEMGAAAEAVDLELDGSPPPSPPAKKARAKKAAKAKPADGAGCKPRGSSRRGRAAKRAKADAGESVQEEEGSGPEGQEEEDEAEDDVITAEPEFILCMDNRNKYWVKQKDANNMYDFKFVDANQVKQLRNVEAPPAEGAEDGFSGFGARLLELADEYDRFRRQFDTDARECLDSRGGLNFDLMRAGSHMDMCAMLGTLRDKNLGGPLAGKPHKRQGAVKGLDDMIIHVPAMMLSMVVQRLLNYWMTRAQQAEMRLAKAT